ncbi:MAG: metallopeptidase family protein, partial [Pseudomonadota bacterium]
KATPSRARGAAPRAPRSISGKMKKEAQSPMLGTKAPGLEWFEAQARETVTAFPEAFTTAAQTVLIRVAEWPDDGMLSEVGLSERHLLTGLYTGIPLTEKSVFDQPLEPDQVWLFREPILLEWRERQTVSLKELVAHVTVHEFAHHFGWSDDDIARVDRWWE